MADKSKRRPTRKSLKLRDLSVGRDGEKVKGGVIAPCDVKTRAK
jgi:hypothetical protein